MWLKSCTTPSIDTAGQCMKLLVLLVTCTTVLFLSACSTPSKQANSASSVMAIDGVQINNQLSITITDVQVLVPATGNFVSCGAILRHTACSTSFPGRQYKHTPVQVTWKEQGQAQATGNFVIDPPASLDPSRQLWMEVVIFAPGQAGAKLAQHK